MFFKEEKSYFLAAKWWQILEKKKKGHLILNDFKMIKYDKRLTSN